jgi:protein-tyrosine phosphatase
MIDTHSHILPGLDDGSPDVAFSLRMAEAAVSAGVTTVVCTPHMLEFDLVRIGLARLVLDEFKSRLEAAAIGLKLLLGFEVDLSICATASSDELRLLTFEGSRGLLLVEMPHWGWPAYLLDTISCIRTTGFIPLLAHPERNDRIQRTPGLLGKCLDAGAVAQATTSSLDGRFGRASKNAFARHLAMGYVQVLASDAHAHRDSSWTVRPAAASLRRHLSREDIRRLVRVNPERLLSGEPPLPVEYRRPAAWRTVTGRH